MTTETFDATDWPVLFPGYGEYGGIYSALDGDKVEDITPDRIARAEAFDATDGDYSETDLALLVELTDGSWATCMAWCDTTGWGCRSDVAWKWAPTRELAIEQGLDREARRRLGLALPIDAVTTGEVAS